MRLLRHFTPINLIEEKEKFFADQSYNPQFVYSIPVEEFLLVENGLPDPELVIKAKHIVKKAYFGRNEKDLRMMQGPVLTPQQVTDKFVSFLKLHNLEDRFTITWSSSFLSRTSITADTINLKNGSEFRKESLLGTLYHEIGTHALRRINYEKQPWFKHKTKYGFSNYLKTEEGLASLHSLVPQSFKSAHSAALRYLSVAYAQEHSFVELWNFLEKYIESPDRRWSTIVKLKRGLTDTSQPGGFSKDITYFEGMIEVAQWLDQNDYNLAPLYFGKLSTIDIPKAIELNPNFKPILPSFYMIDPDKYAETLREIAEFNEFLA